MAEARRDVRMLVMGASMGSKSLNNRLAALVSRVAEAKGGIVDRATMEEFECPFYDSDVEAESGPPPGAEAFRDRLKKADALLLCSPEYNASMPGTIKNLIDWVSRFKPQPFNGKQALLFSWGGRSAQIQAAQADRARTESTAQQSREQLTQDAHFGALQLAQARRQLLISAKADSVAALRFEVAKNRYIIGRIGMDNLYQAQTEKDQVLTAYLQALRGYWLAYFRLRRTTLYDFERGAPIR